MDSMEQHNTPNRSERNIAPPEQPRERFDHFVTIDFQHSATMRGLSALGEGIAKDAIAVGEQCSEYLTAPLFVDSFGRDHDAREKWQSTLSAEEQGEHEKNKLRANIIQKLTGPMMTLRDTLRANRPQDPAVVQLLSICESVPRIIDYSIWSTDQKIALARDLEQLSRTYLACLRGERMPATPLH